MEAFTSYSSIEELSRTGSSVIYRTVDTTKNLPVILKVFNKQNPASEDIEKFFKEFELLNIFKDEGVIKAYQKATLKNFPAIILEDTGGDSLKNILGSMKLSIDEFLNLAVEITGIVENIHRHNIIHKDINPSNIIWNIEKETVRIIDLGIATELPREITSVKNPNILEGTLAYISPEQTGRMNRSLDYRTDFYSLGVTFYWMLTGRLPFESDDLLKLVHSHIAVEPEGPHDIDNNIPVQISDIVMKLMAKNSEDRYLSAHGLKSDLARCSDSLKEKNAITPFRLGLDDVSDKFEISQKLYGREEETALLMETFERISKGSNEIMLISGYSGVGKSVLINEIHRPIVKHYGYFLQGKFEQLKKDVPYNAFLQAFNGLARQILGESETVISKWKEKLSSALGANSRIVTDIFPLFELIIGPGEDVPVLGAAESQNRFNSVLRQFVKALTAEESPVVIFLDDLQWADTASLQLLKLFTDDSSITQFLIIGAYRHNEIADSHPLMLILDEIRKNGVQVNNIFLEPLETESIKQLLCDTLNCLPEESEPLAEILKEKTGGNPFFVNEFTKSLYKDQLIEFSFKEGWSWNIDKIQQMKATDNIIDLIAGKITDLPVATRDMLKKASCLGTSFELHTLAEISKESEQDIQKALRASLEDGMISIADNTCQFTHDRVLEAAYSLIPENEKTELHYTIGNMVLSGTDKDELAENIFFIVNQLNAGIELVQQKSERQNIAHLNLTAGKKALSSNAYNSALTYLQAGIKLLEENSWNSDYHLTLELHRNAAAAAHFCGEYQKMDRMSELVFTNAETILDTIDTYDLTIYSLFGRNQLREALKTGIAVLNELGVKFPEKPGTFKIIYEILSVKLRLWGKSVDWLISQPEMKDPYKLAVIQIFLALGSLAYTTLPELIPLFVSHTIKLSIKYGNSSFSPFSYATLGLIHCTYLGKIPEGYEYGQSSLKLIEQVGNNENKANALFTFWCFISHWKKPLRDSLQPYLETYESGLNTGEYLFAAVSVNAYSCNLLYAGFELEYINKEMIKYTEAIRKIGQDTILHLQQLQHQVVLNLQGKSENPCIIKGALYDVSSQLPRHIEANDASALFTVYYFSLYLNYHFDNYSQAFEYAEKAKPYLDAVTSSPYVPLFYFYDSLARLAIYSDTKTSQQKKHLKTIKKNQKKMKEWAFHSPENYSHKYHLIEGEIGRITGKEVEARKHYDQAIQLARKSLFLQEEALAMELAGKFWIEQKEEKIGALYLTDALNTFTIWGASAKVKQIKEKFPDILKLAKKTKAASLKPTGEGTDSTGSTESIDLATVIKTSQTLSGEINLLKLLTEIMRLSIENAGAQRGFLILENEEDKKLYIEAEGDGDKIISVLQSIPVEENTGLSQAVIRYVSRTGENIVLNNACCEGDFTDDSYIIDRGIKSLLCIPVTHKGKNSGILYLENNITSNVFTPDRIEVLQLISSQAAISIENARLLIDKQDALDIQTKMTNSFARFVPKEFLTFLNKESITEVELGNQVQKQMTILFSDIRSFASLSEKMTPQENFNFLNSYLKRTGPVIRSNGGFIDKYIGDAIMALFPDSPEDAVDSALLMQESVSEYNAYRKTAGYDQIEIGIGIHFGNLMLGTIGEESRMEGTVISDDVNLSSRIESLTKYYSAEILISGTLFNQLKDKTNYEYRIIDTVIVKGRNEPVTLIEILDKNTTKNYNYKIKSKTRLVEAIKLYRQKSIKEALEIFKELSSDTEIPDNVYLAYIERCEKLLTEGIPEGWNGIERLENK